MQKKSKKQSSIKSKIAKSKRKLKTIEGKIHFLKVFMCTFLRNKGNLSDDERVELERLSNMKTKKEKLKP
jgi:hypothetical protein